MKRRLFFEGRPFIASLLSFVVLRLAASRVRRTGSLGVGTPAWLRIAVWSAVAYQVYVWLCWRTELYGGFYLVFGARLLVYAVPLSSALPVSGRFILAVKRRRPGPAACNFKTLAALLPPFLTPFIPRPGISRQPGPGAITSLSGTPPSREGISNTALTLCNLRPFSSCGRRPCGTAHGVPAAAAFNHAYICSLLLHRALISGKFTSVGVQ